MDDLINIGNQSFVNSSKVCVVMQADAEKVRRILKRKGIEKNSSMYYETAGDSGIRSLIILDNGVLVSSSVTAGIIAKRKNTNNIQEENLNE